MFEFGTYPSRIIVATVLIVSWVVVLLVRRAVGGRFFVAAGLVMIGCFVTGVVQNSTADLPPDCTPDQLCFSIDGLGLIESVVIAVPVYLLLAGVTFALWIKRDLRDESRHASERHQARERE